MALRHSAVFKVQLSYELLHSDMSICYHITPLLKEHFGGTKTDLEIKLIALQLISTMQLILLKREAFHRFTGVDIGDRAQREEAMNIILDSIVTEKKGDLS
jgi:hypothetical protein